MAETFTVAEALERQAVSCKAVGSPLYGALLEGLLDDYLRGGLTAELLDGVTDQPVHDALPLRYLATGHLLALSGQAAGLAAHYPSCGGHWAGDGRVVDDFLAAVADARDAFVLGVRRNVQTNEVGRAPVLASGFALLGARHGLPFDQLEIGSSAGLLSRWDHFGYETGLSRGGDAAAAVRFTSEWWAGGAPDLGRLQPVRRRRACDISPIDVSTDAGRQTMLSFVWPDQLTRIERLRAALAVAEQVAVTVECADAADWLAAQLTAGPAPGATTVLFHSIVWQYLPRPTKDGVRAALAAAGERAGDTNPLCWLRMEPDTLERAALRLTTWPGGSEEKLAEVGYHGADIVWLA
jgi:hypothetical protein